MSTPEQPTQSVTITFKSLGAYPPVSLVAAFTNPPWQPQELDYVTQHESNGDAKYEFSKTFEIPEGEWQYKFHLGSGAWVCDESVETVMDRDGNRNNLLRIKPEPKPIEHRHVSPQNMNGHHLTLFGHEEGHHTVGSPKKSSKFGHKVGHEKNQMSTPYSDNLDALADNVEARQQLTNSIQELSLSMQTSGRQLPVLGLGTPSADGVDRIPCIPLKPRVSDLPTSDHAPDSSMVPPLSFDSDLTSPESEVADHDDFLPKKTPANESPKLSGTDMAKIQRIISSASLAGLDALPTPGIGESFLSPGLLERNNSGAALLPHECQPSVEEDQFLALSPTRSSESYEFAHDVEPHEASMAELMRDPSVEVFPSEPQAVLHRIATLHQELREDDSLGIEDLSESPFSPLMTMQHSPTFSHEVPLSDSMSPARFSDDREDDDGLHMRVNSEKRISPLRLNRSARDSSPVHTRSTHSNRSISSISEDDEREPENYQAPLKERAKSLVEVMEAEEQAEAKAEAEAADAAAEQGTASGYAAPSLPKAPQPSEDDQVQGLRQRGVSKPSPVISMTSLATSQQPINDSTDKVFLPRGEADWRVGVGYWQGFCMHVVGWWRSLLTFCGFRRDRKKKKMSGYDHSQEQGQKHEQGKNGDHAMNA